MRSNGQIKESNCPCPDWLVVVSLQHAQQHFTEQPGAGPMHWSQLTRQGCYRASRTRGRLLNPVLVPWAPESLRYIAAAVSVSSLTLNLTPPKS